MKTSLDIQSATTRRVTVPHQLYSNLL